MRRKIFTFCAMILALAIPGTALSCLYEAGYRVNRSASLPGFIYRLTLLEEVDSPQRGDCVAIDLSRFENFVIARGVERGYVNLREPMLKRIGAIPGDRVAIAGNRLFVNDSEIMPIVVASADSHGGALFPWPTPLVLSPDHYWLVSDPARGFDSRYFGPIECSAFTHRAEIVF